MNAASKNDHSSTDANDLMLRELSELELFYGDIFEILTLLGFRGSTSRKTFNDYIKSLRRLDLPVVASEAPRRGHQIIYTYENVMELVLAMTLRVYHVIPDAVIKALVEARSELYPIYHKAFKERRTGLGAPLVLAAGDKRLELSGVFLDLNIDYAAGHLVSFGPPEVLSPFEALQRFVASDNVARVFLPIPISMLAESVYELYQQCLSAKETAKDDKSAGAPHGRSVGNGE